MGDERNVFGVGMKSNFGVMMFFGIYIPYAQCMEYLPILIQTMTPMLANIPYMEHMGIYCGV
jgi:hypothetical protein